MKTVVATLVIFALLIGFSTFSYYYIDNTTAFLASHTEKLEKSVQAKEWQKAQTDFSTLKSSWDRTSSKWTMLIDHMELDNINISMARLKSFMDTKQHPETMAELGELKLLLKHIPKKEALNIKNIL